MTSNFPETPTDKIAEEEEILPEVEATEEVLPEDQDVEKQTVENTAESTLERTIQLRDKIEALIRRTVQTKKVCDKLDHDNKYLQDYVGNLMNSGEFLSRRG